MFINKMYFKRENRNQSFVYKILNSFKQGCNIKADQEVVRFYDQIWN